MQRFGAERIIHVLLRKTGRNISPPANNNSCCSSAKKGIIHNNYKIMYSNERVDGQGKSCPPTHFLQTTAKRLIPMHVCECVCVWLSFPFSHVKLNFLISKAQKPRMKAQKH